MRSGVSVYGLLVSRLVLLSSPLLSFICTMVLVVHPNGHEHVKSCIACKAGLPWTAYSCFDLMSERIFKKLLHINE